MYIDAQEGCSASATRGDFHRNKSRVHQILHPTTISIALKLHRLSYDTAVPSTVCSVKVDALKAAVGFNLFKLLVSQGEDAAALPIPTIPPSSTAIIPSNVVPAAGGPAVPALVLDLRLNSVDLSINLAPVNSYKLTMRSSSINVKTYGNSIGTAIKVIVFFAA